MNASYMLMQNSTPRFPKKKGLGTKGELDLGYVRWQSETHFW